MTKTTAYQKPGTLPRPDNSGDGKDERVKTAMAFFYARGSSKDHAEGGEQEKMDPSRALTDKGEMTPGAFYVSNVPVDDFVQENDCISKSGSEKETALSVHGSTIEEDNNEDIPLTSEQSEHSRHSNDNDEPDSAVVAELVNDEAYRHRVQQEIIQCAVQADVVSPEEVLATRRKGRRKVITCGLIVAVIVSIVIALSVVLTSRGSNHNQPMAPTASPTQPLTRPEALRAILLSRKVSVEALTTNDAQSPQLRALAWLAEKDEAKLEFSSNVDEIMDRYVLAVLYYSTNGVNWWESSSFLSPLSVCSWKDSLNKTGVFCNEHNQTTSIRIEHNSVSGSIPSELGHLSNLTSLDLSRNKLQGTIPLELGLLSQLVHFDLSNNTVEGRIPSEIGQWANLTALLLPGNQIQSAIPTELGRLGQLVHLDLSSNVLESSIPSEFGTMSNLQTLILPRNQLTGTVPSEIGFLKQVGKFDLSSNDLEGSIPTQLGNMKGLRSLILANNGLHGSLPTEIGLLGNLTTLDVDFNRLGGPFPSELWKMSNLEQLRLQYNTLSGEIPTTIGILSNLQVLHLWQNAVEGPLPTELGELRQMVSMDLTNQTFMLTPIPSEIGLMTNLQQLRVMNNPLTGTVPTELGFLRNLTLLDFSYTELSGTVPTEIAALPKLEYLYVQANNFTGDLTPWFCNRTKPLREFFSVCNTQTCECCGTCV